jgi:lipoprotein NlpI
MRCFDELIKVDPAFPPVYNAKGMIFDKLEDYEHSYAEFSRAIELDRNNSVFYHNRGCCLKNMERYDDSIADFL